MKYLIAVLPDRIEAEEAYTKLLKEGIDQKQVEMVGKGYKTADEFGFLNPNQEARKQIIRMAIWLFPFGFAAGYVFNVLTEIYLFDWAGALGNHIIAGFFGAIAALMGAFFVGGGVGIGFGSGDALPYRNRLNEGKYLVVVKGSELVTEQATRLLRQFNPETLQGYEENQ
ncbi:hypothetical protein [Dactylococcopsis salina]|uniref:Uncharacterized protein n=1 Tax=Dactylococcopsis salina (strain PCC 8305) TaxID=13035 RepID=K9YUF5_DACS8|nr:hypothetical protein [Dactylococcopsis salina]AFZ50534.1 hypothetical protein Dacsa_1879 [Dactylococcopsis salina PCC 8305]